MINFEENNGDEKDMTSSEKFDLLMDLDKRGAKVKITTVRGEEILCKLRGMAEDEEDWAYGVITLDTPPKHCIIECNYIAGIEELK